MLTHITVFEHQALSIGPTDTDLALSEAEAEALTKLAEVRPGFCQRGYRSIRFGHHCGIVAAGRRIVEVLPKVDPNDSPAECRSLLLNLLRESHVFPVFRHLSVAHHLRKQPLLELFISIFFDEVSTIVRGGLLRRYQELEEDLPVVRGRIAL